jgi:hypothetical protein
MPYSAGWQKSRQISSACCRKKLEKEPSKKTIKPTRHLAYKAQKRAQIAPFFNLLLKPSLVNGTQSK